VGYHPLAGKIGQLAQKYGVSLHPSSDLYQKLGKRSFRDLPDGHRVLDDGSETTEQFFLEVSRIQNASAHGG
jgi:hypothetical protein